MTLLVFRLELSSLLVSEFLLRHRSLFLSSIVANEALKDLLGFKLCPTYITVSTENLIRNKSLGTYSRVSLVTE